MSGATLPSAVEVPLTANVHFAHNPSVNNTRSTLRPLTSRETMSRAKALAARNLTASSTACSGQMFVGLFFDGTGNNREADYASVENDPQKHKHSNIVRLFHAYPDKMQRGTARYYRFYVPGVGTSFPEIGDSGGSLGTSTAWYGEPRLIWGITRLFNAVSDFVARKDLIPDPQAGRISCNLGRIGSSALHRNNALGNIWTERLKALVSSRPKNMPYPEQINVSVFGFSRGAAKARAFVNWLYDVCENDGGEYKFAGIPLRVDFLGIFDTVASVGIAGGFSNGILAAEGRQSWADCNMQIHPKVECCLHIVAAHEVRATFPVDSVRVEGKYPANVKEYVYPGAHSDVGGGYAVNDQGKTDALARIAGFEMYCAALAAGVPFMTFRELKPSVQSALAPSEETVAAFKNYMESANVSAAPVEEMMRAHMAHYFTYRYQSRRKPYGRPQSKEYYARPFFRKAGPESVKLRNTQLHFLAILAAVVETMEYVMENGISVDGYLEQPHQNLLVKHRFIPGWSYPWIMAERFGVIRDGRKPDYDKAVEKIKDKLKKWRKWLNDNNYPFLIDGDSPERDVLSVVQTIDEKPQSESMINFFDHWVHDSMAGLASDGLDEFLLNGIGLFKFRRVYWGDRGDAMLREKVSSENAVLTTNSKRKRQQRKQWDLEAAEFRRTRS